MRQTNKYYWVKRFDTCKRNKEVALLDDDGLFYRPGYSLGHNATAFSWISNEPVEEPKVTFENLCYYVVDVNGVSRTLAKYYSENNVFEIMGSLQHLKPDYVVVISGPYSLAELTNNKRIN
jgi:hypothetical protein